MMASNSLINWISPRWIYNNRPHVITAILLGISSIISGTVFWACILWFVDVATK